MVILINIFSIKVAAIVNPTSDFYINDYAKLLNSNTQNYIININKKLYDLTGAQIVVVTVPNLEGDSLEEYATRLFRNFGIGDKNKNNGVLLLLALEEREFRIEVGYGLEGCLNDAKTGRIQDEYIIPYLKNNQWDEGIRNGFNAILEEVSAEYGIRIENAEVANMVIEDRESFGSMGKIFMICVFVITIISLYIGILTKRLIKLKKQYHNLKNYYRILKKQLCILCIIYFFSNLLMWVIMPEGWSFLFAFSFLGFLGGMIKDKTYRSGTSSNRDWRKFFW